MFFGNLLVFFLFQGKTHIDNDTRTLVFSILAGVAIIGIVFLGALRKPNQPSITVDDEMPEHQQSPKQAFINAVRLFMTKRMLQLSVTFIYTGKTFEYLRFSSIFSYANNNFRNTPSTPRVPQVFGCTRF